MLKKKMGNILALSDAKVYTTDSLNEKARSIPWVIPYSLKIPESGVADFTGIGGRFRTHLRVSQAALAGNATRNC